ncbi:MAG: hypothetical protein JWM57_2744, partial [Phycisphaerales bacterium]|nr:hypothetical protein [Phycisphaerales bacterium]
MFRGRTPRKAIQRQNLLRRAVAAPLEELESRRMLTTLQGGDTFFYLDASKKVVRITLVGEIVAEFTAARVRGTNNSVVIRDLIRANPTGVPQVADGADLFNIYVAAAKPGSQILISSVANADGDPADATPFGGSPGAIRAFEEPPPTGDDNSDGTVTPDATGSVYIGARTVDINPNIKTEEAIPIVRQRFNASIGVRPNTRVIYAGLETAPGVTLTKVFIGGTITGLVNVEGSVGTFYAGNILTGDPDGLALDEKTTITNNFTVNGDLQNLYVGGSIGSNSNARYRSGVNVRIGGKLGYVHVANTFAASVQVRSSPSAPGLTTPVDEAEYILQGREKAGSAFFNGLLSGSVVGNDTANEQAASSFGDNQGMSWTGTLQGNPTKDYVDNYSLSLLAGQSAVLQLTALDPFTGAASATTDLGLGIFDPLGRLVATDRPGPSGSGGFGEQFQITAKVPGIYRLAVAFDNNGTFDPTSNATSAV